MVTRSLQHASHRKVRARRGILWIEFFRTVWRSFGRFLAILAIIALGAGFFSGLKTAKPAMVATADKYLGEQNAFDLQLISTLGFETSDVEKLADSADFSQVQGLTTQDILGKLSGEHSDATYAARSMPNDISKIKIEAGRTARAADECVADSAVMGDSVIGKKITWSSSNTDASLSAMSKDSCTITGVASSPDYLNIERGASDIGDGKTYAFLYLPTDAFTSDVYSQVQATVDSHGEAFSTEYKKSVNQHLETAKNTVKTISEEREQRLISDARDAIRDAAIQKAVETATNTVDQQFAQQSTALAALPQGQARQQATAQFDQQKQQALEQATSAARNEAISSVDSQSDEEIADTAGIDSPKTYVLTRSSNLGLASFENDTGVIEGIALVFPIFFIFVAAMVCLTTVTKMIDEERGQIGLLKALGYHTGAIAAKYLGYSGAASFLGCVAGITFGTFIFPLAIWSGYGIIYKFAPITFVFDYVPAIAITLGYLAIMAAVTWTVCWRELRSQPAQLLRPEAPKPGKKIFLEHIGILWNHLSFLHKVSLRNVFRFKKRLFMILAGVAGCTALIVACFGIRDSTSAIPQYQYGQVNLYSASVQLQKPTDAETTNSDSSALSEQEDATTCKDFLQRYDDVIASSGFVYENTADMDITTADGQSTTKSVSVIAAEPDSIESGGISDVVRLHDGETPLDPPARGKILISKGIAHNTGQGIGDKVTLRTMDGGHVDLTISGIFDNYIALPVYINLEDAQKMWSDASARTVLVRFDTGTDEEKVYEQMESDKDIQFTTPVSDDKDQLYTMMRALDAIVALIILSAGALALIVLLNLTGINITERIREIATIKVLGFYQRETASYVFRENILLTSLGIILGLPLGKLFHMFIMSQVKVDAMYMVPDIAWQSYVYSALLTFAFLGVTFLVMYRRIAKIDMAGALKSPE